MLKPSTCPESGKPVHTRRSTPRSRIPRRSGHTRTRPALRLRGPGLGLVHRQLAEAKREISRLLKSLSTPEETTSEEFGEQRDATILSSLPGGGQTVLTALLVEAPPLVANATTRPCGVARVTRRSGKSTIVVRRLAAHPRLRDAAYHWARVAVQHDATSKNKYAALRARGYTHRRALRSVADRLLAVACAMLRTQTLYGPDPPRKSRAA